MTMFVATINVPGYMPHNDGPPVFETAREAWDHLSDARREAEDDVEWPQSEGYSETMNVLEALAGGDFENFGTDPLIGIGTVYGETPGYGGDHDLGVAYSVSVVPTQKLTVMVTIAVTDDVEKMFDVVREAIPHNLLELYGAAADGDGGYAGPFIDTVTVERIDASEEG